MSTEVNAPFVFIHQISVVDERIGWAPLDWLLARLGRKRTRVRGCGKPAFYLLTMPHCSPMGYLWKAENTLLPDGTHPKVGTPVKCGNCGKALEWGELIEPNISPTSP